MSFSNTDYLLEHLPGRFVAHDATGLLRRFLSVFGDRFDSYDAAYDAFHASITPATATAEWISFWLDALFGWSWFPWWFTLADKRRVYGNFARHLARRGTRAGIELWLRDFGIVARVHTRALALGEIVLGESAFQITRPLLTVVEILETVDYGEEVIATCELVLGEGFLTDPRRPFTDREIADLIRFMQPNAQDITVLWRTGRTVESIRELDGLYWQQVSW